MISLLGLKTFEKKFILLFILLRFIDCVHLMYTEEHIYSQRYLNESSVKCHLSHTRQV